MTLLRLDGPETRDLENRDLSTCQSRLNECEQRLEREVQLGQDLRTRLDIQQRITESMENLGIRLEAFENCWAENLHQVREDNLKSHTEIDSK